MYSGSKTSEDRVGRRYLLRETIDGRHAVYAHVAHKQSDTICSNCIMKPSPSLAAFNVKSRMYYIELITTTNFTLLNPFVCIHNGLKCGLLRPLKVLYFWSFNAEVLSVNSQNYNGTRMNWLVLGNVLKLHLFNDVNKNNGLWMDTWMMQPQRKAENMYNSELVLPQSGHNFC